MKNKYLILCQLLLISLVGRTQEIGKHLNINNTSDNWHEKLITPSISLSNPRISVLRTNIKSNKELTYVYYNLLLDNRKISTANVIQIYMTETQNLVRELHNKINEIKIPSISFPTSYDINMIMKECDSAIPVNLELTSFEEIWVSENHNLKPQLYLHLSDTSSSYNMTYDLLTHTVGKLSSNSLHSHKDTILQSKVYSPDILTNSHSLYGSYFKDNEDSTSVFMNSFLIPADISCKYDDSLHIFRAENSHVKIINIEAPDVDTLIQNLGTPQIDRSMSEFEDIMVLYHIETWQTYLKLLGLFSINSLQIIADPHAQNGLDNSVYTSFPNSSKPSQICFGTGGVDDAEDADVIIHEYGHAISYAANGTPSSMFTNERHGLDEGYGDYMATSYSYGIDTFSWDKMFTWDGHNPFWPGRKANTTRLYSEVNSQSNIYTLGEIWNDALFSTAKMRSKDSVDKLVMESLFLLTSETSLPEAAYNILLLDSILYNGSLGESLCYNFTRKSILGPCSTKINLPEKVLVINSADYMNGIANLEFVLPFVASQVQLKIYNMMGSLVDVKEYNDVYKIVYDQRFAVGNYFVSLFFDNSTFHTQINILK